MQVFNFTNLLYIALENLIWLVTHGIQTFEAVVSDNQRLALSFFHISLISFFFLQSNHFI